jgi:hypothetical protein
MDVVEGPMPDRYSEGVAALSRLDYDEAFAAFGEATDLDGWEGKYARTGQVKITAARLDLHTAAALISDDPESTSQLSAVLFAAWELDNLGPILAARSAGPVAAGWLCLAYLATGQLDDADQILQDWRADPDAALLLDGLRAARSPGPGSFDAAAAVRAAVTAGQRRDPAAFADAVLHFPTEALGDPARELALAVAYRNHPSRDPLHDRDLSEVRTDAGMGWAAATEFAVERFTGDFLPELIRWGRAETDDDRALTRMAADRDVSALQAAVRRGQPGALSCLSVVARESPPLQQECRRVRRSGRPAVPDWWAA